MATKQTFITLDAVMKRNTETYPLEIADLGAVELKRLTRGDRREVVAKYFAADTGIISDFQGFLEELTIRACVTPAFTADTLATFADDVGLVDTVGRHVGWKLGLLNAPIAATPAPTVDPTAAETSTGT